MRGLLGRGGGGHETSDTKFLRCGEEGVQVVSLDIHLSLVHEVENGGQVMGSYVLNDEVLN